jgi:NitT/TauT family transport system ATP-binding protein/sulfonate transport system ATP-binding protein
VDPQASGPDVSSLEILNARKAFTRDDGTEIDVLSELSFTVRAGEIVSVIGPSGCGKSTLLRMIAGLIEPTAGELRLGNEPIHLPGADRGLMFQSPSLFPWKSVRRNVETGLVARGVLAEKRHEVDEFLELVGLTEFAEAYPHQLSGGMAQRVALARALVNHPRVLLLDEPLGALDQFTRMRMQDEILRIWEARRTTMMLVTHDIDEALYMSDRIVMMTARPGRVDRILDVPLARPRRRDHAEFLKMRAEILQILHFVGNDAVGSEGH